MPENLPKVSLHEALQLLKQAIYNDTYNDLTTRVYQCTDQMRALNEILRNPMVHLSDQEKAEIAKHAQELDQFLAEYKKMAQFLDKYAHDQAVASGEIEEVNVTVVSKGPLN
jgi:hypothetical protein